MDILLTIHSWVRWLILLAAIVAILKLGLGWRRGGPFDSIDRGVLAAYTGLLDLQALLGLVLLFGGGFFLGQGFPVPRILHAIVMILAVVTAHLSALWRQSPPPARYRGTLAAIAGSLALIVVGIILITVGTNG